MKKSSLNNSAVPDGVTNPRRYRARSVIALVSMVTLAVMTLGASVVPVPYVVQSAGPTVNVLGEFEGKDVLNVSGAQSQKTSGELRLTTVAVQGAPGSSVRLPAVFAAWFNSSESVAPVEALYPDTDDAEGTRLMNTVQMSTSQQEAVAVALREQGITYTKNVGVSGVRTDGPAHGIVEAGDIVLSVNGKTATSVEEYVAIAGATPPGSDVTMKVKRKGKERTLSVPTKQEGGRSVMGIVLSEGFEFPVKVNLAVEGIGGPSAGLMFSLGIYDDMTPGDLTGGKKIAGTGTITEAGEVGPIGGIRQKLVGAKSDGAAFFLAPKDNCSEVAGHVPDGLNVVAVSTFDDAKDAVEHIASKGSTTGLPTCG